MYGYEIPVNESAYAARSRYLNDKKMAEEKQKAQKEYTDFISNSRDYLVAEAFNMILTESLDEDTSEEDRQYGKALIEGFVKEQNTVKLLSDMSRKSLFLAGIAEAVKETHEKIVHGCADGDKNNFRITKTVNDEFFQKLVGLKDNKITEKINERVCNAVEDYIQANVNDKLDLEELAEKTKERIEVAKSKGKTAEEQKKIEESVTLQYKKQVQEIKNRSNHRKVGLYEQVMHYMTQGVVSDQNILESFTTSSGKLNMNKITGKVNVLYTFLEMLNTTKIVNVDEAFVESVLKDMK